MDAIAYSSGNLALAELAEAQAETLAKLKKELAASWEVVNGAINEIEVVAKAK